jgi:Sec-independent protein translocase protein TatA
MSDKAFGLTCDECGAILREFRDAVQQDEQELKHRRRKAASASGREEEDEMRLARVSSVASMPMDEMHTTMRAQYPGISVVRRRQAEHESLAGHSVFRDGWRTMNMPYEELLRVMRVLSAIRLPWG